MMSFVVYFFDRHWASNMANITAYACIIFGIASMDWGLVDNRFGTTYVVVGMISM